MGIPEDWRQAPTEQQPDYGDTSHFRDVLLSISKQPPLVDPQEPKQLLDLLEQVSLGHAFLLQGGDCAERFSECTPNLLASTMKTLFGMAHTLQEGWAKPVVVVARMAGQYAKPRSSPWEVRGSHRLPVYRGDAINGHPFTAKDRGPDVGRLWEAWLTARRARSYIHRFLRSQDTLVWWHSLKRPFGAGKDVWSPGAPRGPSDLPPFFCSHEALLLPWEFAQTHLDPPPEGPQVALNLSAPFLWIGERTRGLRGGHVLYAQTLKNPLGVKVGPHASAQDLVALCHMLNPNKKPGKLTLITRMGAHNVLSLLPPLVEAVKRSGVPVIWVCDPMHGNGVRTPSGLKTRHMAQLSQEMLLTSQVLKGLGGHLGGVHLEMTGGPVTECLGSPGPTGDNELHQNYASACDPRLNGEQSLALAHWMVAHMEPWGPSHVATGAPLSGSAQGTPAPHSH